jgi:hypothetical protein
MYVRICYLCIPFMAGKWTMSKLVVEVYTALLSFCLCTCLVMRWEPTNVRLNTLNVVSIFWRLFGSHLQTWFLVLKSILAEATICSFYVCLNRFHFIHLLIFQFYPFVWYLCIFVTLLQCPSLKTRLEKKRNKLTRCPYPIIF